MNGQPGGAFWVAPLSLESSKATADLGASVRWVAAPQRLTRPRPPPCTHPRACPTPKGFLQLELPLRPGQRLLLACSPPQLLLCLDEGSANFSVKGLNTATILSGKLSNEWPWPSSKLDIKKGEQTVVQTAGLDHTPRPSTSAHFYREIFRGDQLAFSPVPAMPTYPKCSNSFVFH